MKSLPSLPIVSGNAEQRLSAIEQYLRELQLYIKENMRSDVKDYVLVASPNNTIWKIIVSDAGVVSATQA